MLCRYCSKNFTARGLPRHLKFCKSRAATKQTRSVLALGERDLSEDATSHVLSFLGLRDLLTVHPLLGLSVDLLCDEFAVARGWKRVAHMPWRDLIEKHVLPRVCGVCEEPLFAKVCRACAHKHAGGAEKIPKTRAKSEYRLSDAVLADLPHEVAANPRYRRAAPMRLYRHEDLMGAAFAKHGDAYEMALTAGRRTEREAERVRALNARRKEIEALLRGLDKPVRQKLAARAASHNIECVRASVPNLRLYGRMSEPLGLEFDLHFVMHVSARVFFALVMGIELRKRLLELRDDSEMCWTYIYEGRLIRVADPSRDVIENIVDVMEEMRYLFSRTNYGSAWDQLSHTEWSREQICMTELRQAMRDPSREAALPALWKRRLEVLKAIHVAGHRVCTCDRMQRAVIHMDVTDALAHGAPCNEISELRRPRRPRRERRPRDHLRELELTLERISYQIETIELR
jgi:hypothetical protein